MNIAIIILVALFIKHFVIDFLLQPPYMYLNKGKLFHPGGWIHAGLHGLATFVILATYSMFFFLPVYIALGVMFMETLIHYIMDFIKVNVCKKYGYGPTTHKEWFTWLGIDQTVHSLTYILIIAIVFL